MAVPETARRAFTLAGLRAASCQTQGLLRLPPSLQSAIAAFIGEIPTREVKQSVARLASHMKARKGLAVVVARESASAVEGSDDARAAVDEYLASTTATAHRMSRELGFAAPLVRYEYDERNVAAYVASRMPAVYGAVHRVLSEVAARLPDFRPVRVLDYGSGPGTVLWAMRELWQGVEHVNLVEPSRAMAAACRTLLQEVENLPLIKVHPSLSLFSRGLGKATRLHDLVVSSYALNELSTPAERITAVRQLWALTSDVLVLIEPGTPHGSSIVREMRAHILQMEKKKKLRGDGEARGAFVVAPCPHDGQCPMDKTKDWCHFVQRLERTTSQRVSKRQSKPTPLRAYEDEKFSFVVLRRGSRPSVPYPLEGLTIEPPEEEEFEFIEDPMSRLEDDSEEEDGQTEEADSEEEGQTEEADLHEEDEVVIGNRVADVGSGWARIVRTPIRRGRRTILDLCAATEKDGSRGTVTRVVCSRRGNGAPLHPQARKSRWGDLWPC